ncbi:Hydroxyacylglutathione hydrolase [uncultured archaeon]|nr:Hydroxyacylglutathione hydrolase [uncultured archaeon]
MAEVKVLIEGVHEEKGNKKLKASSTITLIKSDKNIIVDTGSFSDGQKIIDALAKDYLKPEDIDIVVLTHLHIDHTRNTNIFSNAVLYVKHSNSGAKWNISDTTVEAAEFDNLQIAKDVKTILTPGHFPFHISVVVNTQKGVVVIAGDAISKKDALGNIPRFQWNNEEYLRSQKKILDIADYIIPGHGKMFKVEK